MAQVTVTAYWGKDTNDRDENEQILRASYSSNTYLKFRIPDELKGKQITRVALWAYVYDFYSAPGERVSVRAVSEFVDPMKGQILVIPKSNAMGIGKNHAELVSRQWNEIAGELSITYPGEIAHIFEYALEVYASSRFEFYSPASSYKPYIVLTYDEPELGSEGEYPWRGYVNRHERVTMGCRAAVLQPRHVLEKSVAICKGYQFKWRPKAESAFSQIVDITCQKPLPSSSVSHTFEPETFPEGGIVWQIATINANGAAGDSPSYSLTTTDSIPTASVVSPVDAYVNNEEAQTFSWTHTISTGTAQTAYELEYSMDSGGSWLGLASGQGAEQRAAVPAGILPPGTLSWRVRTCNADSVAGEWSVPAQIVVYGPPSAPVISGVSNSARPVIRWQAAFQSGYGLEVLRGDQMIYELPEQYGTEKSHRVAQYLEDGEYTVRVRIRSEDGAWSAWGRTAARIAVAKPAVPQVRASAEPYLVRIEVAPHVKKNLFVHTAELPMTANGLTLDYDRVSGEYVLDGTIQSEWTRLVLALYPFRWKNGQAYSMSLWRTGGTVTAVGEKDVVFVAEAYKDGAQLAERFFVDAQLVGGQTFFAQSYTAGAMDADQVYVFLDPWFCKGNTFQSYRLKLQLEEGPPSAWESGTVEQPAKRYLLRDGEPVARLDGPEYLDHTALGTHSYVVRAVSASDGFADSAPVTAGTVIPSGAVLAPADAPGELHPLLLRRGAKPSASGTLEMTGELVRLAGRRFPVCEFREQESEALTLAFSIRDRARWEALRALAGSRRPLLYRDVFGNRCYGVIRSLTRVQDRIATDFTAVFDRVDYVERIEYDAPEEPL